MTGAVATAGIDIGSGAVKAVVMRSGAGEETLLSQVSTRIRKRDMAHLVHEVFEEAVAASGVDELAYVATTGDGDEVPFATGHFYGMTTHARGALFLEPRARAVLDVGALHARAVAMDERGRVLRHRMTSQCASGSGQFLENISRYLGVSQSEVGRLSLSADGPETVSSICAVLAETDVINMVSRGISTPNILRGIHNSMAGRFSRLLLSIGAQGVVFASGGLAGDEGLLDSLRAALAKASVTEGVEVVSHPASIHAGAIGAALWGAFRHAKVGLGGIAWKATATV